MRYAFTVLTVVACVGSEPLQPGTEASTSEGDPSGTSVGSEADGSGTTTGGAESPCREETDLALCDAARETCLCATLELGPARAIAVGDVDADGDDDLARLGPDGGLAVYLGNAGELEGPIALDDRPGTAAARLVSAGELGIVRAEGSGDSIGLGLVRGRGIVSTTELSSGGTGAFDGKAGDFDGDGKIDIVRAFVEDGTVRGRVWLDVFGAATEQDVAFGPTESSVAYIGLVCDLDGDGFDDVVAQSVGADAYATFGSAPGLGPPEPFPADGRLSCTDLDADGMVELVDSFNCGDCSSVFGSFRILRSTEGRTFSGVAEVWPEHELRGNHVVAMRTRFGPVAIGLAHEATLPVRPNTLATNLGFTWFDQGLEHPSSSYATVEDRSATIEAVIGLEGPGPQRLVARYGEDDDSARVFVFEVVRTE